MTMETYLSRQQRAAAARRARFLIEEWEEVQKPTLEQIERAALGLLHALGEVRVDLMRADDIAAVDALACDTAGRTIDLLDDLLGTQRRELDDCGGDVEDMRLDLSMLNEEHARWELRWNARRPA